MWYTFTHTDKTAIHISNNLNDSSCLWSQDCLHQISMCYNSISPKVHTRNLWKRDSFHTIFLHMTWRVHRIFETSTDEKQHSLVLCQSTKTKSQFLWFLGLLYVCNWFTCFFLETFSALKKYINFSYVHVEVRKTWRSWFSPPCRSWDQTQVSGPGSEWPHSCFIPSVAAFL